MVQARLPVALGDVVKDMSFWSFRSGSSFPSPGGVIWPTWGSLCTEGFWVWGPFCYLTYSSVPDQDGIQASKTHRLQTPEHDLSFETQAWTPAAQERTRGRVKSG